MGIYKFGNNTYPRRIRRRSNLGHIIREKSASYGPGNTVSAVNIRCMRILVGIQAAFHIGLSGCSLQDTVYQLIILHLTL